MSQKQEYNTEEQRKREVERERKELAINALTSVLRSYNATNGEKVEAARLLLERSKLR